jgi:D-alanine transaminase
MSERKAYVNGSLIDLSQASISILDRGFLFGDGVYEVMPVYNNKVCFLDRHIRILNNSLQSAKIAIPDCNWSSIFNELINHTDEKDFQIYLQITRGCGASRHHDIPKHIEPTIVAFTLHHDFPKDEDKLKGIKANLVKDIRWERCDIKSTSMLANVMVNDEAVSVSATTAILIKNGLITEGSSSNVFIVDSSNTILTPPLNTHCLPGITREVVIELIQTLNWPFKETYFDEKTLFEAKEVWITSTTKEIYPVASINERMTGNIQNWQYWKEINKRYTNLVRT